MAGFEGGYTQGSLPWIIHQVYFQYYSLGIFLVCVVVMIGVSYLSAPPSDEKIRGLTFATVTTEQRAVSRSSWSGADIAASGVVLVLILVAYLFFRG
jgi:SSS family solute:Na+ symporter